LVESRAQFSFRAFTNQSVCENTTSLLIGVAQKYMIGESE
jgi:hypothetical protein